MRSQPLRWQPIITTQTHLPTTAAVSSDPAPTTPSLPLFPNALHATPFTAPPAANGAISVQPSVEDTPGTQSYPTPGSQPPRRRAKKMTTACLVKLIRTCIRFKGSCISQRGSKRFWTLIADHFCLETGRDAFNWQTAQKRVLQLTDEHRIWLSERKSGEEYNGSPSLCDALDEWIAHLDSIKAMEEARDNLVASWPQKRTAESPISSDTEPSGSQSQSKRQRKDNESPSVIGHSLDELFQVMTNQLREESELQSKFTDIERVLDDIENMKKDISLIKNRVEEFTRRLTKLDMLDQVLDRLKHR